MGEVRLEQEVLRWVGVVALLYATVLLVKCPCDLLLKCDQHSIKFQGALALALGVIVIDNFTGPDSAIVK